MSRNKNEWFKFYYRDWLESERVLRLSPAAQGIYFRCMCLQAIYHNIPANVSELSRRLQLTESDITSEWESVKLFFESETRGGEERLFNADLREVISVSLKAKKAQSKGAEKTNAKRIANRDGNRDAKRSGKRAVRASNSNSLSNSSSVVKETEDLVIGEVAKKQRQPNLLFDAVCEVCKLPVEGKNTGGQVGKCLKGLEPLKVTPEEIRTAGELFALQHPFKIVPAWFDLEKMIPIVRDPVLSAKIRGSRNNTNGTAKSFSDKGIHEYEPSAHQQDFVPPVEEKVGF